MTAQLIDVTETAELPVLEFVAPMPGFPEQRRFVLVRLEDEGVLYSLTSIDVPHLRFLVVPPAPFFPDYEIDIDNESQVALGLPDADDLLVLLVITAGDTLADTTVNLMAPIVVNQRSRCAVQLVLGASGLPVRAPLLAG
ncbi:MAG: flagellar assembly protein FliW [Actinobacteria bacterium 13_2_20CM_2_71_6]|nr:MAG: flagellar assembly protein FliW [Actinobacteria bacterium 13_2_20CM_2_71_6]